MKAEQIIENSIISVQKMGIKIVRGPIFVLENNCVTACDCSGATLVSYGKNALYKGWLKELCVDILGKDTFWWWRFNYGFNQGRSLELFREEKNVLVYYEDNVSKYSAKLAKRLGLYK